jgi:hypothetical protein
MPVEEILSPLATVMTTGTLLGLPAVLLCVLRQRSARKGDQER